MKPLTLKERLQDLLQPAFTPRPGSFIEHEDARAKEQGRSDDAHYSVVACPNPWVNRRCAHCGGVRQRLCQCQGPVKWCGCHEPIKEAIKEPSPPRDLHQDFCSYPFGACVCGAVDNETGRIKDPDSLAAAIMEEAKKE